MSKKTPYSCIRCGYETNHKRSMKDHLVNRKKICPSLSNDIELTDEIKQYILDNKVYKISRTRLQRNIEAECENHYIYLLRPKENVNHNENVYKLGKTVAKKLSANIERLRHYGVGSELILVCKCEDSQKMENELLVEFHKHFSQHIFGNEYFVGDVKKMTNIIYSKLMGNN